jgi:hypothetical protein
MPRRKILLEQQKYSSKPGEGQKEITRHFSLRLWLADVAILIPIWFILVGKMSWLELALALVAAPIVATLTEMIRRAGFAHFYPRLHWLIHAWRTPEEVLLDCWILVEVMAGRVIRKRQERGFFKRIAFHSGGADARSAARRALAITLGTLSPNTYILDIEPYHNFALLHQIRPARLPGFIRSVRDE